AQSIGEPGTQLTLRTFHVGGVAGSASVENSLTSKFDGTLHFDGVRTLNAEDAAGEKIRVVIGRTGEIRIVDDKNDHLFTTVNVPYGSSLKVKDGQTIARGDIICTWDPFNNVIISEIDGQVNFESLVDGITFREE